MRHEGATITTLFTIAVRCRSKIEYDYTRKDGATHTHVFESRDTALLTVFAQVVMEPHSAPNEACGEWGEFEPAADFLNFKVASVTYTRNDGTVNIPAYHLTRSNPPFEFLGLVKGKGSLMRYADNPDLSPKRAVHLCGAHCWYGNRCNSPARTPEEIEAISF